MPLLTGRGITLYRIGGRRVEFNTNLEKSKFNSAIDRINSNIDYALKQGLEFTDYHQEFQTRLLRYSGVKLTKSGKYPKNQTLHYHS